VQTVGADVTRTTDHRDLERVVAMLPPRSRDAVRANAVGAVIADTGRVLAANEYFLELVGRSADDPGALPLSWIGLTPPRFVSRDAHAIAQARVTGVSDAYEKDYVLADGRHVQVRLACGLLSAAPIPLVALVARADDVAANAALDAWTTSPEADLRSRPV
jgi:PAS domain-containing protein